MADDPKSLPTMDPKLAAAFVAFQAELTPVPKSADNAYFKSKYADASAVQRHVGPSLAKNKLAVLQLVRSTQGGTTELLTRLVHESGTYIEEAMDVIVGTKGTPQDLGSGITYARRYAYMAITGAVAEGEDDDGNAASNRGQATRPQIGSHKEPKAADPPRPSATASSGQISMMMGAAKRASGLEDRKELIDFFTEEIGKAPNEVLASEAGEIIKRFNKVASDDTEVTEAEETA